MRPMLWRGDHVPGHRYTRGDVVRSNESVYILDDAFQSTADPASGNPWSLLESPAVAGTGAVRVLGPFSFAFDDDDLIAGREIYAPVVGDLLLGAQLDVQVAFDPPALGELRVGAQFIAGSDLSSGIQVTVPMSADVEQLGYASDLGVVNPFGAPAAPVRFLTTTPLKLHVDADGMGAPIASLQGAGRVYLFVTSPFAPSE